MSHTHRFHVELRNDSGAEVPVGGAEAHHALHVARIRIGDQVFLFDGAGREVAGRVSRVTRHEFLVEPTAERCEPMPVGGLVLAQAWLHKEKSLESLIQRGTEIGVRTFLFFRGDHSERPPALNPKHLRYAIEACKQCGRLWLPDLTTAAHLDDVLAHATEPFLAATQDLPVIPLRDAVHSERNVLIVGPEGDFSERELALMADAGARAISLGDATLRSEVAAMVGAALIQYETGRLGPLPKAG